MSLWDYVLRGKIQEIEQRMVEVSEAKAIEKAKEFTALWMDELQKANGKDIVEQPKTLMYDPFQLIESLQYKERAMTVSYDTLRLISERNPIVAAVLQTRVNQVAAFSRVPRSRFDVGFELVLRDDEAKPTAKDEKRIKELETMMEATGFTSMVAEESRDNLDAFLRKVVRDSLTYDQMCWETVPGRGVDVATFYAIDASTIRLSTNPRFMADILRGRSGLEAGQGDKTIRQGGYVPLPKASAGYNYSRFPGVDEKEEAKIRYVQVLHGKVVNTYTEQELAFGIRNPRTNIKQNGYGTSELEILLNTVVAHMWSEEYNRRFFSQGSAPKGIIHFEGAVQQDQLQAFRRQWHAQVSGVYNAWRTPVIASPAKLQYMNLQMTNKQMEFSTWIEYLIKLICAVYLIDPAEINFDLKAGAAGGGGGNTNIFESRQEQKLKMSRDRGLRPLLRFVESEFNKQMIYKLEDKYEFQFVGLDAKSEQEQLELRIKEVTNFKTIDEVRAEYDLKALGPEKGGDLIKDASYINYMNQMKMMALQQQQGQEQQGPNMDFGEEDGGEGDFGEEESGGGTGEPRAQSKGSAQAEFGGGRVGEGAEEPNE